MTGAGSDLERLTERLHRDGVVQIGWSLRWLAFYVVSSGVFALYGLVGLVVLLARGLGDASRVSLGDLPVLLFLTVVPGAVCARFLLRWRRHPVPVRADGDGLLLATPYGRLAVAWADVAEVNRRRSFFGPALEVVASPEWCAAHHGVRVRPSVGSRRAALVVEAPTSPSPWALVGWLDGEARRRGGGPRLS